MSTQKNTLQQLRKEYTRQRLARREMLPDPFAQFEKWLQEALASEVPEPNAMTLCTAGRDGQPSARIVLLKDIDDGGFLFYTNYLSRKGQQISENPQVSLSFFWQPLERQIRIEGIAEKVTAAQSDEYFNSRPRGSRLAASVSPQSQAIESRDWLEHQWEEANVLIGQVFVFEQYFDGLEIAAPVNSVAYFAGLIAPAAHKIEKMEGVAFHRSLYIS